MTICQLLIGRITVFSYAAASLIPRTLGSRNRQAPSACGLDGCHLHSVKQVHLAEATQQLAIPRLRHVRLLIPD